MKTETSSPLPDEYSLRQNFPNPFNPVTTIRYSLPEQTHVKLVVYDLLGREVEELVNRKELPGAKTVQFEAGNLASGVYFYRLSTENYSETRKLIILK